MEFLAAATECLKSKYEGRRLYSRTSEEDGGGDDVLPTFESFNESGKKTKPLKAWELFARMLMQVRPSKVNAYEVPCPPINNDIL